MAMVIIFDLMDTLIRDPFFTNFFSRLNEEKKKLWIKIKNHDSYILFEEGKILEQEYARISYKEDPRKYGLPDVWKVKKIMFRHIEYLPGIENVISILKDMKSRMPLYTVLASNYSIWYHEIFSRKKELEDLFDYVFISCEMGIRKPHPSFFEFVENTLQSSLGEKTGALYFDDRKENCDVATKINKNWHCVWIEDPEKAAETISTAIENYQKKIIF